MGANATTFVPTYVASEVLTAADLNVTNSGIPVFATTVTRDAAFDGAGEKTLAEGQFAYIEASNATQYYDGAAWQDVATSQTIAIFNETQASGTAGGASVATTYTKRVLNTSVINNIGATLTSSVIALLAGTYQVRAMSPFFNSAAVSIRLRNTTDSTTTVAGVNAYVGPTSGAGCIAQLEGTFTITGTKNFEVQYYQNGSAVPTNGLGVQLSSAGVSEIYTQITIVKVG
jgi:hypothetical protein